jgi:hypothetical protein
MSMLGGVGGAQKDSEVVRASAEDRQQRMSARVEARHQARAARPGWLRRLFRRDAKQ